jgi:hypothetical protein
MLIRVRSNVGVWRVDGFDATKSTLHDVVTMIAQTRPDVVYEKPMCSDAACNSPLDENMTLQQLGLSHGSMIHCRVDPSTTADISVARSSNDAPTSTIEVGAAQSGEQESGSNVTTSAGNQQQQHMRRIIDSDGSIKLVPCNEAPRSGEEKGFRKGLMALRDIKMHWTRKYEFF